MARHAPALVRQLPPPRLVLSHHHLRQLDPAAVVRQHPGLRRVHLRHGQGLPLPHQRPRPVRPAPPITPQGLSVTSDGSWRGPAGLGVCAASCGSLGLGADFPSVRRLLLPERGHGGGGQVRLRWLSHGSGDVQKVTSVRGAKRACCLCLGDVRVAHHSFSEGRVTSLALT